MRFDFPNVRNGQVVGLLGGSFDPAHGAHVHLTREALKRFGLDHVVWLVSPGNPLKEEGPADLSRRVLHAQTVMRHPRVEVSDIEARLGTRYTAQSLAAMQARFRRVRFVWLMGADNLVQFHRWKDWRWIMENVSVGVLARPGDRMAARTSVAARVYAHTRLSEGASYLLGRTETPRWCFVNMPMRTLSSTQIRAAGDWHA